MTVAEARAWVATLPPEQRPRAQEALTALWDDGFLRGAGKCPRVNPFDSAAETARKRKRA